MGGLIKLLITHLKEVLFKPKDHFERAKKTASTRLLVPLITIVGAESIFVAILSAIGTVEIRSGNFFLRLIANSSSSFIELAIAILISFVLYVGSNFYYARRIKQSAEELEKLNKELRRTDSYNRLKKTYDEYLKRGQTEQAYLIAGLMIKRFPNEVDMDGDFLESILSAIDSPQLADIRRMLVEAPQARKDKA
jgi:hypothetical protein